MMDFIDGIGNELVYWPISGLIAGQDSEVLNFTAVAIGPDSKIYCTLDDRAIVWLKRAGDASFTNISDAPYDLTGVTGDIDFSVYVTAVDPVVGLDRVPLSVVAGIASGAGWTS